MASSGHFREKLSTRGKAGRSPPGKQSNKENLAPKTGEQPVVLRARLAPYLANNLPLCRLAPLPDNCPVVLPPCPLPGEQPALLPACPLLDNRPAAFRLAPCPANILPLCRVRLPMHSKNRSCM